MPRSRARAAVDSPYGPAPTTRSSVLVVKRLRLVRPLAGAASYLNWILRRIARPRAFPREQYDPAHPGEVAEWLKALAC
jgi:hypothetical protein